VLMPPQQCPGQQSHQAPAPQPTGARVEQHGQHDFRQDRGQDQQVLPCPLHGPPEFIHVVTVTAPCRPPSRAGGRLPRVRSPDDRRAPVRPRSIPGTACPPHRGAMTKAPRTTAALDVRGLTKRYGSRVAVDDLTFSCTPGSVTGFLGPNGAGKSTTLRILTGLAEADAGQALVGSRPYRELDHPARTIGVM